MKERINSIIIGLAIAFMMGAALMLAFTDTTLTNAINGKWLWWYGAFAGLLIAALLTWIIKKVRPSLYIDAHSRGAIYFCTFTGWFILTPCLTGVINKPPAYSVTECRVYRLVSKSYAGNRYKEYRLFVDINGREERFTVSSQVYNSLASPGQIELCTQMGLLGYEVIKEFKPTN